MKRQKRDFFHDDEGFTTVSMVLALLLTLALVFTGAQVYRMQSASAEVQDVADIAALSAENQVAEFTVIAQFCDAVVLSLSLTSATVAALGVVTLCVPATFGLSEGLLSSAGKLVKARDAFAERAALVLNRVQEALPFFCACCAAAVAQANNASSQGSAYLATAVLVPSDGQPIAISTGDGAQDILDGINEKADEVKKDAKEAEEAAKKANQAKLRAFLRDCGDNPSYCMYERARWLAGMEGTENPLFSSIDTWSFSAALERARCYYSKRLAAEAPDGESVSDQARSALRGDFYRFAVEEMAGAYVNEADGVFEANFPHLPYNTEQMRQTRLYTQAIYPITTSGGEGDSQTVSIMHAWAGCPGAAGASAVGSLQQMESGEFKECSHCEFRASSLGKVAAAPTSIQNGFEYHYEAVANEAAIYQEAMAKAEVPKRRVKQTVSGFLREIGELIRTFAGTRFEVQPPGRYGVVVFAVNAGSFAADQGIAGLFTASGGGLGPRAAISAATLATEESDEGATVISSLLDGLKPLGGCAVGAASVVLETWSNLLGAYAEGTQALTDGVKQALDGLPLTGPSGLGSWVSGKLKSLMASLGLQPADLRARKAVLVDSSYVVEADGGSFAAGYIQVKSRVLAASVGATDLFSMVMNDAERSALEQVQSIGGSIGLGSIEILGPDGPSIPLTLPIPEQVRSFGTATVQQIFDRIRSYHGEQSGGRIWQ